MLEDKSTPIPLAHSKDCTKLAVVHSGHRSSCCRIRLSTTVSLNRLDFFKRKIKVFDRNGEGHSGCSPMQLQCRRRHWVLYKSSELHHFILHKHIKNKCTCCVGACICRSLSVCMCMCPCAHMFSCICACLYVPVRVSVCAHVPSLQ